MSSLVGNSSMRHLSPLGVSFFLLIIELLGTYPQNSFVSNGSLMIAKRLIINEKKEIPKDGRCLIEELPTKDGNT